MQNSFKVTLHQEWVVGGWIVLLQNQEMAGSRIGRAGGPGPALALPTRGPGLRPWLPRASAGPAATLPAAALVALSCARPRQGRHQPSPSIRAAACAPGPFGISWRSADPGYDHRLVPDQPASMWAHSRFWDMHSQHHIYQNSQAWSSIRSRGTGGPSLESFAQRLFVQLSDPMFPSRGK